jgi:hypothetical protein
MNLCTPQWINTFGISFDIIGAWLVAYEIVKQYNGKKYRDDVTIDELDEPVRETSQYQQWEIKKYKWMWYGLISLTIGFVFQIASTWMK